MVASTPARARVFPLMNTTMEAPGRVWAVDAMGPFPVKQDGFMYVLVMICGFMRWVENAPTRTQTAEECVDVLVDRMFCRFGLPMYLRSDRGGQFIHSSVRNINSVIAGLPERLKVKHHKVLSYTPQANGTVEREIKEVLRHL